MFAILWHDSVIFLIFLISYNHGLRISKWQLPSGLYYDVFIP